jgi:hypothetical protein
LDGNNWPTSDPEIASTNYAQRGLYSPLPLFNIDSTWRRLAMKKMLLTLCGGLLLAGAAIAQDTTTPSNAPPPQDQPTASPAPDPQPSPAPQPQAQPSTGQTPNQPASAGTPATASPSGNTPKIAPGSVIPAQLAKSIDAKKAKTGDEVVAKVTQDMKTNTGEVIVPKDTKNGGARHRSPGAQQGAKAIAGWDHLRSRRHEKWQLSAAAHVNSGHHCAA